MGFYDTALKILPGILCALYRVRVVGAENIPDTETGFLLCANHTAALDPFVICSGIRSKVFWIAKEEAFRVPVISGIIRAFGSVPIKRGSGDIGALRKIIELLGEGKSVGIFPQGHRNPGVDPRATELHSGLGMILWRSKASVLPVYVANPSRKLKIFHRNTIVVGPLIPFTELPFKGIGNQESYKLVTDHVFDAVCELEKQSGVAIKKK